MRGSVTQAELAELQQSVVFVSAYEGSPQVVLEALTRDTSGDDEMR